MRWILLVSICVIATCGLIYELIAGTIASYLLGDTVTQFSLVIGVYLFAMGIGSYLSKFINKNLLYHFVVIELLIGLIGGVSSIVLFYLFNHIESFKIALYLILSTIGILVGLEIPILMSILKKEVSFKDLVSKVFSFDYAGALIASVAFPIFFVPNLGLIKTALFFGLLNSIVGTIIVFYKQKSLKRIITLKIAALSIITILTIAFIFSDVLLKDIDKATYEHENIIYSKSSKYQKLIVTSDKNSYKLYLNNNLQFSSNDEYRYHEALVHPCFVLNPTAKNILILGGGDGCAAREVLKYDSVKKIQLIDLDKTVTELFKSNQMLSKINNKSLLNKKVEIINDDAFSWLKKNKESYDIIIIDFPDPSNFSIGKLYSTAFYSEIKNHLNKNAIVVIQSTSPYVAQKSYWCIVNTLNSVGFYTLPYHNYVPSFGDWGYIIASSSEITTSHFDCIPNNLKFFDSTAFVNMQTFPKDMDYINTEVNRLNNQILVQYFEEEWNKIP